MKMPPLLPSLLRRGQGWLMGPHPLLLRRRGALFRAARNLALLRGEQRNKDQGEIPRFARNDRAFFKAKNLAPVYRSAARCETEQDFTLRSE